MADKNHQPSEFDPFPGQPLTEADRVLKAARDAARKAGQPVPPIARPYNGIGTRDVGAPPRWYSEQKPVIAEVQAICTQCPVRQVCADYAIRNREPYGVWGGLTPKQRRTVAMPPRPNRMS